MLYVLQLFSSFSMFSLIWLVQILHYPSFKYIREAEFKAFHKLHSDRITWIVLPLMLCEMLTAIALCALYPLSSFWILNLLLTVSTWLLTGFLSVPLHDKLGQSFDIKVIHRLVLTNWPRTFVWTLKTVLLLWDFCKRQLVIT